MPTGICSCPHCGRTGIPFDLNDAHTKVKCKKCGRKFTPMGRTVEPPPIPIQDSESQESTQLIRFNCSKCGKRLKVPPHKAGVVGSCTRCGAKLVAPGCGQVTPPVRRSAEQTQAAAESPHAREDTPKESPTSPPGKVQASAIMLPVAIGAALVLICGVGGVVLVLSSSDSGPAQSISWPTTANEERAPNARERAGSVRQADPGARKPDATYPYSECETIVQWIKNHTEYPDEVEIVEWGSRIVYEKDAPLVKKGTVGILVTFRARNQHSGKQVNKYGFWLRNGNVTGQYALR